MSLASIPISEIISRNVKKAKASDAVLFALKLMAKHKISSVVIVDENHRPIGIFTEKDAVRVVAEKISALRIQLKSVMSGPVISINTFTSIKMALTIMGLKNLNHLPVVENEKLVGIVTEKDIFRYVLRHEGLIQELLAEMVPAVSKELFERFGTEVVKYSVWPEPHRVGAMMHEYNSEWLK